MPSLRVVDGASTSKHRPHREAAIGFAEHFAEKWADHLPEADDMKPTRKFGGSEQPLNLVNPGGAFSIPKVTDEIVIGPQIPLRFRPQQLHKGVGRRL